jgi:hypothetical protein
VASGLQFLVDHCEPGDVYEQTCAASPTKPVTEGSDLMGADPFWVIARKRCGTVGRTAAEMRTAVQEQLDAHAQTIVENVVWNGNGLGTIDPTLATSGATTVTPDAPGAGAAVAALEAAFYAASGFRGVIHVNTAAYAAAAYSNLVLHDLPGTSNRLNTPIGTTWSFGAGYPITGPDETPPAAGFVWAFITSPVTIWSTDVPQPDPGQTLDRTLNQWDVVAERVYAATWDCPQTFAVQIPVAAPAVATAPEVPAP